MSQVRLLMVLEKPPYRVPSMEEIAAIPWNGYNVVSTFSGCGGSCLGYRMAGYRVKWASEFIPAAQETYRANHPSSHLNTDDIREVSPQQLLEEAGMEIGEVDILDGSPPCASFSTSGRREKGWGQVKDYSDTRQRVDDLFFEYVRMIRGVRPKVFVAENVSGLIKGSAKGYFKEILREMKASGYRVSARLLNAAWLGVPQSRQRLIFVGVREDLDLAPVHPDPLPYYYTVRDALPHILKVKHGGKPYNWKDANGPSPTILQSDHCSSEGARFSGGGFVEASPQPVPTRVIHDTSGTHSQGEVTDRPCPAITVGVGGMNSSHYKVEEVDISRFAIGREWDKLEEGEQSERYFNLVRSHREKPCPTVTQTGGSLTAAGVTHPTEKRKFTIAELKRICAFPDDFELTGSYAKQWERLGRSVPPVMMSRIAGAVARGVLDPLRDREAA